MDCISLQDVILPKINKIGCFAFDGCLSLKQIRIPEGMQIIGENAFSNCTSLRTVELLEGAIEIGNRAFEGCSSLRTVILPETVKN